MTRILRLAAWLTILTATMGADGSCSKPGDVDTNRPRNERRSDPKATRVVAITANGSGPYTLLVISPTSPKRCGGSTARSSRCTARRASSRGRARRARPWTRCAPARTVT